MRSITHPFHRCATALCCFCFDFGCDVNCYIVATLCIVINGFMWRANFGIGHVALYVISIFTYLLYLIAGILLFLGAFWERNRLKLAYCWLCLVGIIATIVGLALALVFYSSSYVIWGKGCHEVLEGADVIVIVVHVFWLLIFSIYTPMIVLGNLCEEVFTCYEVERDHGDVCR